MKTIKKIELRARRIRVSEKQEPYLAAIRTPGDVSKIAAQLLGSEAQEVFIVFLLDIKNRVLGYNEVARGGVDTCPVDPRAVFRAAVMMGASSLILAHCHPSGDPTPSSEDLALTTRLTEAGKLLSIQVLDHVIIGHEEIVSMAERGMMR